MFDLTLTALNVDRVCNEAAVTIETAALSGTTQRMSADVAGTDLLLHYIHTYCILTWMTRVQPISG
jgi:hypothetical protein